MTPRTAATLAALGSAAALLALAWNRGALADALSLDVDEGAEAADWLDEVAGMVADARTAVLPTPAAGMTTSPEALDVLKRREGLRLTRYRLGDGGWTIGYGRFFPDNGAPPPERITQATAEAWFAQDVAERGERWVRAYVSVPLRQHEFDALVSMAFNLRPSSFKVIADAVNRGEDPEAAALRYVRAGTSLEAGLRNRRAAELAMYRQGVYA